MFKYEFIKGLSLILFVSRFRMIGHLSSNFPSLQIDDFHETKQISNDFDSVLKKVITFFRTLYFFSDRDVSERIYQGFAFNFVC